MLSCSGRISKITMASDIIQRPSPIRCHHSSTTCSGRNNVIKLDFRFFTFFYIYICTFLSNGIIADIIIISTSNNKTTEIFDNHELPFGILTYAGITGKIKLAEPDEYACSPLTPPPSDNKTGLPTKWFVLVKRASCTFETKVKMAAMSNYQAVIIHNQEPLMLTSIVDIVGASPRQPPLLTNNNNQSSQNNQQSSSSLSLIYNNSNNSTTRNIDLSQYGSWFATNGQMDIPAILVSYLDGHLIREHYLNDKGYSAILVPRTSLPLNAYLLPFTTILVVCLFMMATFLIIQIIKCVRHNRRRKRHRLTNQQLKQLKTLKYSKNYWYYETCAICIDDYNDGDKLRILPCNHAFHMKCVDPWLTGNKSVCPICKAKVHSVTTTSDTGSEHSSGDSERGHNNGNNGDSSSNHNSHHSINNHPASQTHNNGSPSLYHHNDHPHHHTEHTPLLVRTF